MSLSNRNLRDALYVSTMCQWQPEAWPYSPPPTSYHVQNRHWTPPKSLPWYYTCDPLYLLGYLAIRVLPPFAAIGFSIQFIRGY